MYSKKIFNGSSLINLPNIKYFYINTMFIPDEEILEFVGNLSRPFKKNEDDGFLNRKTIYKLKGDK